MAGAFLHLDRVGNGYAISGGGRSDAPMFINQYTLASDDVNTTVSFTDYTAVIAGFSGNGVDVREMHMVKDTSDATWHVHSDAGSALGGSAFAKVLFISRAFCTDSGVTTQS